MKLYFIIYHGMSECGMVSDYKPLNDLMSGLIALIFKFTLLSIPGVTSIGHKGENCSISLADL